MSSEPKSGDGPPPSEGPVRAPKWALSLLASSSWLAWGILLAGFVWDRHLQGRLAGQGTSYAGMLTGMAAMGFSLIFGPIFWVSLFLGQPRDAWRPLGWGVAVWLGGLVLPVGFLIAWSVQA